MPGVRSAPPGNRQSRSKNYQAWKNRFRMRRNQAIKRLVEEFFRRRLKAVLDTVYQQRTCPARGPCRGYACAHDQDCSGSHAYQPKGFAESALTSLRFPDQARKAVNGSGGYPTSLPEYPQMARGFDAPVTVGFEDADLQGHGGLLTLGRQLIPPGGALYRVSSPAVCGLKLQYPAREWTHSDMTQSNRRSRSKHACKHQRAAAAARLMVDCKMETG